MRMEKWRVVSLPHWVQLPAALGCPWVPLPPRPNPPRPRRAQQAAFCWGICTSWGICTIQTHSVRKEGIHLLALRLDLISKRCLSLNYCSAPLVSIIHLSSWCFWDHPDGFCTPLACVGAPVTLWFQQGPAVLFLSCNLLPLLQPPSAAFSV